MKQPNACNIASSRPRRGAMIALLGTALITSTAIAAPTQPTYRIVVLPELPDTQFSVAKDISDAGKIFGDASQWGSNGYSYGISWGAAPHAPQRLTELAPNSPSTVVSAVNDAGFVVGSALMRVDTGYHYVAVMWDPSGAIVELGDLPRAPFHSKANDINASGIAVGYGTITYRHMPVFWTARSGPHLVLLATLLQARQEYGQLRLCNSHKAMTYRGIRLLQRGEANGFQTS